MSGTSEALTGPTSPTQSGQAAGGVCAPAPPDVVFHLLCFPRLHRSSGTELLGLPLIIPPRASGPLSSSVHFKDLDFFSDCNHCESSGLVWFSMFVQVCSAGGSKCATVNVSFAAFLLLSDSGVYALGIMGRQFFRLSCCHTSCENRHLTTEPLLGVSLKRDVSWNSHSSYFLPRQQMSGVYIQ